MCWKERRVCDASGVSVFKLDECDCERGGIVFVFSSLLLLSSSDSIIILFVNEPLVILSSDEGCSHSRMARTLDQLEENNNYFVARSSDAKIGQLGECLPSSVVLCDSSLLYFSFYVRSRDGGLVGRGGVGRKLCFASLFIP